MCQRPASLVLSAVLIALTLAAVIGAIAPDPVRLTATAVDPLPPRPWVIAHRGASAYAPENTVPAFTKAIAQRATFVEIDVQRTKDGVLVCLHDLTLDRTTDVAERFAGRARVAPGHTAPRFWLDDFTYDEVRQLDAGRWFHAEFAGTRIPTFAETIAAVRGRTGLFIELKAPERYPGIERQVLDELRAHGLGQPDADPATPILVQSFTVESLERFAALGSGLPIHLLFSARDADTWLSAEGLARARRFSTGLSPEKALFATHAAPLREARRTGMPITPWTFRATQPGKGHATVSAEMAHMLTAFEVDGLITDNPDLAPGPQ
jgi:glycerophosphoryl diester phosphodiesterase